MIHPTRIMAGSEVIHHELLRRAEADRRVNEFKQNSPSRQPRLLGSLGQAIVEFHQWFIGAETASQQV